MDDETFGQYVRRHRKKIPGLTQEKLALALDLTKGYISMIENDFNPTTGEAPRLDADKLCSLARLLNAPEEELLRRSWVGAVRGDQDRFAVLQDDAREAGYDNFDTIFSEEEKEKIDKEYESLRLTLLRGVIETHRSKH